MKCHFHYRFLENSEKGGIWDPDRDGWMPFLSQALKNGKEKLPEGSKREGVLIDDITHS